MTAEPPRDDARAAAPPGGPPAPLAPLARGEQRRALWILLAITLVAGLLRWTVMAADFPIRLMGDETYYARVAINIAEGRGHKWKPPVQKEEELGPLLHAFRPPAQAYLLSNFVSSRRTPGAKLDWHSLRNFADVQVAIGTLLVLLTGLLGWSLFEARTGLLAAGIVALYPTLVAYSSYLWSETLFSLLIVASLLLSTSLERTRSILLAVAAGAAFGLAALTRELALPVACGVCFWLVVRAGAERRRRLLQCGVLLLCTALVVLPWSLRNQRVLGRFVPIATVGSFAMREGNTFGEENWILPQIEDVRPFRKRYFAMRGDVERMDMAMEETRELIREEQPWWIFKKLVRAATILVWPDSYLFEKFDARSYGPLQLPVVRAAVVVTTLSYLLVATLGAVGIAAAGANGRRWLVLLLLGGVFLVHVLANASTRFRVPWMPLVCIYAAYAFTWRRELRARLSRPAVIGLALFLALLWLWCVPYFFDDAVTLWKRARYALPRA